MRISRLLIFLICPVILANLTISPPVSADSGISERNARNVNLNDSPNVLTSSLFKFLTGLEKATVTAEKVIIGGMQAATQSTVNSAKVVADGVDSGVSLTAGRLNTSVTLMASHVTDFSLAGFIRPADEMEVPVIEPYEQTEQYIAEPQRTKTIEQQPNEEGVWPMRGRVTAKFGVPHWPYQPIHTGIDISDGNRVGVTPIMPFKSGRVIAAVVSKKGLGNHVVVDHGAGITSVYAHLHTISVHEGQEVNQSTVLGTQGTTGVSTGPHLHFEIRQNGKPVNPSLFINGHP